MYVVVRCEQWLVSCRAENSRMIIFHQSQMTANDIMSWRTFRILIFITKWAQLLNCFYLGFYLCHMQMRVKKVAWDTSGHQSFGTTSSISVFFQS
eukprot:COSAG01_NODE_425_length_17240_cov_29.899306_11_plen_95_part_00